MGRAEDNTSAHFLLLLLLLLLDHAASSVLVNSSHRQGRDGGGLEVRVTVSCNRAIADCTKEEGGYIGEAGIFVRNFLPPGGHGDHGGGRGGGAQVSVSRGWAN